MKHTGLVLCAIAGVLAVCSGGIEALVAVVIGEIGMGIWLGKGE